MGVASINYEVKVANAAAASELSNNMKKSSIHSSIKDDVAASTGVSAGSISMAVEPPVSKAAGVMLTAAVQVDSTNPSGMKTKLENAMADKTALAQKLADEGVETQKNVVIQSTDIEDSEVDTTQTSTVEVTESKVVMEVDVQVDKDNVADTTTQLTEAFKDETDVAEKLGEAGVVKGDGSAITSEDVGETKVTEEATDSISVDKTDLSDNVINVINETIAGDFTITVPAPSPEGLGQLPVINRMSNSPSPRRSEDEDEDVLNAGDHAKISLLPLLLPLVIVGLL